MGLLIGKTYSVYGFSVCASSFREMGKLFEQGRKNIPPACRMLT
jgi:hypothetical protein